MKLKCLASIKPKKHNIIFDFDGTLLDSRQRHIIVLTDCINQINGTKYIPEDFNDFISYKSDGNSGLTYLQSKEIPNANDIFALWVKKIEDKEYLGTDILYPNVCECLNVLKSQYNLFLVSARNNKENAYWQVSNLNISSFFKEIFFVSNTGNVGDNKYMAVKPLSIAYVIGDTEIDYDLAKKLNCIFFPVNCGFRSAAFWEKLFGKSYNNIKEVLLQIKK